MNRDKQESLLEIWTIVIAMQLAVIFVAYMLFAPSAQAQALHESCDDVCKESTCSIVNTPPDKWDECCECQFDNTSPAPEIVNATPQTVDDGLGSLPELYPSLVTQENIDDVRSSHERCKANYRAAVDTIVVSQARYLFCEAQTPTVRCDTMTDFRDGANGNLWKPVADGGSANFVGNPVALVDGAFADASCSYFSNSGQKQGNCSYAGINNGERAHFRLDVRCTSLESGMLQLIKDDVATCYDVPTPCERID